jgi:hypothetical protein
MGIASFARTTKQFECLELINVKPRIKAVSIDDVLSPVIQTETKIRSMMSTIKRSNVIILNYHYVSSSLILRV